ncbi:MAG: hypothetical protein AMXMBFR84_10780 [Candidatus Hydrogenedentota bacterium]
MAIPDRLQGLKGSWQGSKRVWFEPGDPVCESDVTFVVSTVSQGRFLHMAYQWNFNGEPQDGLIILGAKLTSDSTGPVTPLAVWADSWHMGHDLMECAGLPAESDAVAVLGAYGDPQGSLFGWRIEFAPRERDSLRIAMFNIPPQQTEVLAVKMELRRSAAVTES